jgi:hypothetical protein
MDEDETRDWGLERTDRCPVCFVPPGAPHIEDECVYTGLWNGPEPHTSPEPAGDSSPWTGTGPEEAG